MKLNILLFLSIPTVWTWCIGQQTSLNSDQSGTTTVGDTVEQLGNNIMLVYQDKKNNYWFGSWETGVYKYDGLTIINYNTKHGLPTNRIDEIKEDLSGNIYFNSCYPFPVITRFDGQTFTKLKAHPGNEWTLQPNDLWFRYPDKTGQVARYDGNILHALQFPKHPTYPNPFEIYSIYKDRKGNVWFGSNPAGVCRYNGKSFDWITESDVTELHDGPANGVRSIIEDKDGYFWFNTMYRYKVYNHNPNQQSFYNKEKSIGNLDGMPDSDLNEYLSIIKDNHNELWIATYLSGIWRYNGKGIAHYPVKNGTKDITVFSIYMDNAGNLWLGTHENGAYKFNGQIFERFKP